MPRYTNKKTWPPRKDNDIGHRDDYYVKKYCRRNLIKWNISVLETEVWSFKTINRKLKSKKPPRRE